ncbi:MAG: hypothetical protein M0T85_16820 [Dehalococcoidales bacterium]|nr:hypothetical protein [Dehalococcoidales bacterium]
MSAVVRRAIFSVALVVVLVASTFLPSPQTAEVQDGRFYPETNFSISSSKILDYVQSRGGVAQFGLPISREFILFGDRVQFFQRYVVQIRNGQPTLLNLLGPDLMPYTSINGAVLPGVDASMSAASPAVGSPDYATGIVDFVKQNAPNSFDDLPVNFGSTFFNTVKLEDAFPQGNGDAGLLPLMDLEMWGVPLSKPAYDPNNFNFVYQRFQRNIMHFDKTTGRTQGLLLAQYLKAIITGQNLPPDLEQQAKNSPFYRQYNNDMPLGLNRPDQLPNTNMKGAFEPESTPGSPAALPVSTGSPGSTSTLGTPTPTATPGAATPTPITAGPNCNFDGEMSFDPQFPQANNVVTITVTSPTAYNSVNLAGPGSPHFIGVGSGLRGYVWKWRVLVTESGLYNYDFFVNGSQMCVSGFFNSGGATPTPGPTATPTVGPTLTPTPTPPSPVIEFLQQGGVTITSAARGQFIMIVGRNFGANQATVNGVVIIGQANAGQANLWGDTSINVQIPSSAITGTQSVQVVSNGQNSNVFPLTIN